jgi:hypothetical protein
MLPSFFLASISHMADFYVIVIATPLLTSSPLKSLLCHLVIIIITATLLRRWPHLLPPPL